MKFFGFFFLAFFLVCLFFLFTDGAGSGMGWPTGICAALAALAFGLDARRSKSLNDKAGR